jgi:hypothetical protein
VRGRHDRTDLSCILCPGLGAQFQRDVLHARVRDCIWVSNLHTTHGRRPRHIGGRVSHLAASSMVMAMGTFSRIPKVQAMIQVFINDQVLFPLAPATMIKRWSKDVGIRILPISRGTLKSIVPPGQTMPFLT